MAVDIIENNLNPSVKKDVPVPEIDINNNEKVQLEKEKNISTSLTPYEKLSKDLVEDERCVKEFSIGKRIGFYRMRGDLGSGNFAKVKLGFHCLVKGMLFGH